MDILDFLNEIKTAKLAIKSGAECIKANQAIADLIKISCPAAAHSLYEGIKSNRVRIDLLADFVLDCEDIISALPEKHRRLLELKFLEVKTWEETATALGYSVRHCTKNLIKQAAEYIKSKDLFEPLIEKYKALIFHKDTA